MLDELKSKLGFGGGAVRGRSNDRYDDYDDDYGDYEDDYSEYAEYADDSENDYDPLRPGNDSQCSFEFHHLKPGVHQRRARPLARGGLIEHFLACCAPHDDGAHPVSR